MAATLALSATFITGSRIATRAAGAAGFPGSPWAWGLNSYGQLGNGTTNGSTIPATVFLPAGATATAIAGGLNHSLALTSTGQVLAWGNNSSGQLGNGGTTTSTIANSVNLPVGTTVTAIAAGYSHSLALTSNGQVLAWGDNAYGQLGNGTTTTSTTPIVVSLPSGITVTAIAAGSSGSHSLALTSTGQVLAWGINNVGQLGNGTNSTVGCRCITSPVQVLLPSGTTVTALASNTDHSLALTSTGGVLAWGSNSSGQLGNSTLTTTYSNTPVPVGLPSGTTITAIAAGNFHSLALTTSGQVFAWGANGSGQLGNGTTTTSGCWCIITPAAVSLPSGTSVTAVAGGNDYSLALTSTGQALAWGYNFNGQLGNGTTTNSSTPVSISLPSGTTITAIAAGGSHSLVIQPLPVVVVFPAMTNGAYGGYVTAATIKNNGNAAATIRIVYFNQSGTPVGVGDAINNLAINASWTVRQDNGNSFPSAGGNAVQAGSAIVYSSQPITSFVNEFAPGNVGDATSYTGVQVPSGVGTTLYAPTIVNNAYGGYTTGIGLLNQGNNATDVTVTYRDGAGAVIKTQTVTGLAAHAYQALYSGDTTLALPNGFAGTATITAGQLLGAIVNETGPGGQFSSYDAVPSGNTVLNAPVALNNAYGGYYTGMGIQNTSASGGTVFVTYYDNAGTATAKSFNILAFGSLGVYQGSATDGPGPGAYTAVIQSATLLLVAIVNEVAPAGTGPARQSTSYNTFSTGSSIVHLVLVENAGSDPWNTGLGIMNTGSAPTTVQVFYYDAFDGTSVGTWQTVTLARRAFWGLYQPTGGLPVGTRATAMITASGGGQIAVVCNESSPTTFMSYNAQ
jgi:alpha-tubulin suppressor-like RCC1 family protein